MIGSALSTAARLFFPCRSSRGAKRVQISGERHRPHSPLASIFVLGRAERGRAGRDVSGWGVCDPGLPAECNFRWGCFMIALVLLLDAATADGGGGCDAVLRCCGAAVLRCGAVRCGEAVW